MGFFTDNFGVRGDVRYFRNFGDHEADNEFDIDFGDFSYWRGTGGWSSGRLTVSESAERAPAYFCRVGTQAVCGRPPWRGRWPRRAPWSLPPSGPSACGRARCAGSGRSPRATATARRSTASSDRRSRATSARVSDDAWPHRRQPRLVEDLVRHPVPDPREHGLIQQHGLERRAGAGRAAPRRSRAVGGSSSGSAPSSAMGGSLAGSLQQPDAAEAPRIAEGQPHRRPRRPPPAARSAAASRARRRSRTSPSCRSGRTATAGGRARTTGACPAARPPSPGGRPAPRPGGAR